MSQQPLLQALERELALERAARQELERQTVLKTRQLWHLREQQDKEVQQYQEQLSVLRTSLILAHKQQQHAADPYEVLQQSTAEPKQAAAAVAAVSAMRHLQAARNLQAEDASPTKADQRKAARQFIPDSQKKAKGNQDHHLSNQAADGAVLPANSTAPAPATPAAGSTLAHASSNEQQAQEDLQQLIQTGATDTAEQLLAAAGKVQQLVEQLSSSEPSAAADLSVLQWQLTAVYGSLTCSSHNSTSVLDAASCSIGTSSTDAPDIHTGVLQGVSCTGNDPLSVACSPAAADKKGSQAGKQAVLVDAATGTSPLREQAPAAAAAADASSAGQVAAQPEQQQQQQEQQHEQDLQAAVRTSAAAQLFSGAANNSSSGNGSKLVASNLAWFYVEPGEPPIVKGPYDAGLMLRWFLKGFLDNALRIAGVVQQQARSSGSSSSGRVPPASLDDFQPLGQLLQQVQQGQGYTPAKPGKEQLPSPAKHNSPAQQQLLVSSSLRTLEPGSMTSAAGVDAGGGMGGDGILAKGGSLLAETVGWWLNAAASAQLPGSVSVVDIIEKVISSVAAPASVKAAQ